MKQNNKDNDKSKKIAIIILIFILLATIGVTVWALFFRNTGPVLAPDYAPQKSEENAELIDENDDGDKLQQQQGGGAVSLTYSKEITIDLSEKAVDLMFYNPNKSNQDMMIQLVIQDTVVVQSGILSPGYKVTKLDLFKNAKLSEGEYKGKLIVLYYQQDTGEKAMINTEIPLTITVEK